MILITGVVNVGGGCATTPLAGVSPCSDAIT